MVLISLKRLRSSSQYLVLIQNIFLGKTPNPRVGGFCIDNPNNQIQPTQSAKYRKND